MEAAGLRLEDKLTKLLSLAAQKKNILDYQEIMDILGEDSLNPDCIDRAFQVLEAGGVEIKSELSDEELFFLPGTEAPAEIGRAHV